MLGTSKENEVAEINGISNVTRMRAGGFSMQVVDVLQF